MSEFEWRDVRDQFLRDEQIRNRRLADRIATHGAPLDDEMVVAMRQMASAHLNVPGPRVVQLLDEFDRLRARVAELEAAGDVLAVEASWTSLDVRCGPLDDAVADWRAVRGEGSE